MQNGIGHRGVVDHFVPLADRKLAGDQRGALTMQVAATTPKSPISRKEM